MKLGHKSTDIKGLQCTNFVLECDAYSQLRRRYIDDRFHGQQLQTHIITLFSSKNEETIRNLTHFIHTALNVREVLLK